MMETVLSRSVRLMFSGSAVVVGLGFLAQPVMAQDNAPVMRVEITGSAIKRIDAETAVPVTVIKMDDLKKQGVTTIEQVLSNVSAVQATQGTSQVVGLGTGGASFADLRGIGANKTLILLNGRRLANNAFDSSSPDLNMIPFAALERVEVLRDGASSLYGSDAVGGVINFITKKDFTGGVISLSADSPQKQGGFQSGGNFGFGMGDIAKDGYNIFGMIDHQVQHRIGGTQRDLNTRYAGGLSPTPSPANYFQDGDSANPAAPACTSSPNLITDGASGCFMTTSSFVDYVPKSERTTGLVKGSFKLTPEHELGLEFLSSHSKVQSQIAPVPYGGLYQNRKRPDGSLNPFYPGNPGAIVPSIPLSATYMEDGQPASRLPGFIHVKWRDLPNGPRADENINEQQRLVASLSGVIAGWDYEGAFSYNENKVTENLSGYSNGQMISAGVLNGVINPFGPQDAAGTALLESAALNGNIQNAKGTTKTLDLHASRELGDWMGAGRASSLAVGAQASQEEFLSTANHDYAEKVISSTGIDPDLRNAGSRNVYALFAELNVPLMKTLDMTVAARYDKYSDFGSTVNPKVGFRFQPSKTVLLRGSYSTGFRAPSLYELNAATTYGNTNQHDDPVNCPGGTPIAGKPRAANCDQQFEQFSGGNTGLSPEKSKNAALGLVFEPINNMTVAIDLWAVRLSDQIGTLSEDDVFASPVNPIYASLYHRNAQGNLSTDGSACPGSTCGYVDLRNLNLGGVNTNGVDLSVNYKWKMADIGAFTFGGGATYVNKYEYQNTKTGPWNQNAGVYVGTGPVFRWQDNFSLNWNKGDFGAGLTAHYKSSYLDSVPDQPDPDNTITVASYTTFDLSGSWNNIVFKNLGMTFGVKNMFDRQPPLTYQTQTFQAGYDPRFTDPAGRTFYLRANYSF